MNDPVANTVLRPVLTYYDVAPGVVAFSSTRRGGYGTGRYGGFNVNRWCGDDPVTVGRNHRLLCEELGLASDDRLVIPHQTHGTAVFEVSEDFLAVSDSSRRDVALDGVDALMTDVPGVCVGVSTADCIPVLLYDEARKACCAVHAGWRGTVARIVETAVGRMQSRFGTRPEHLKAVIGPGISLEAFEVGDEVYDAFRDAGFDMEAISRRFEKWHIDLWACNRMQLERSGVRPEAIVTAGVCTYFNSDDYFSARRLGVASGRIFNGIMLRDNL